MIKFKTHSLGWGESIVKVEVEVERETKNFVVIKRSNGKTCRDAKETGYTSYFDTFEQAKHYLLDKAENEVHLRKKRLEEAKNNYRIILALREE